jgi:hypothetical protein
MFYSQVLAAPALPAYPGGGSGRCRDALHARRVLSEGSGRDHPYLLSTASRGRVKLLLDEHLSPTLIARCAERGVVAQSVV